MSDNRFSKEEKEYMKYKEGRLTKSEKKGVDIKPEFEKWRKVWFDAGPVHFATEILKIDPENGGPLLLSQDQIDFLNDVCLNGVQLAIISAGRGCLTKGTMIQMSNGSYKSIETIKKNDEIIAVNEELQLVKRKVIGIYNNGTKEVFRFKNSDGGEIFPTEDHPFLSGLKENDGVVCSGFKPIKNFIPDKYRQSIGTIGTILKYRYNVPEYPISDELIILLGRLIAEGNYTSTPKITSTNREFLELCESIVRNNFDVNPKYYSKGNGWDLILSNNFEDIRPRKGIRGSPKSKLIQWLETIGIYRQVKGTKRVPEFLFRCSNRQIKLFIDEFAKGDGNLYMRKGKRIGQYLFTLYAGLAGGLADDLKLLFSRLGISTRIKNRNRNGQPQYEVYLSDSQYKNFKNPSNNEISVVYGRMKESKGYQEVWDIEIDTKPEEDIATFPCFLTQDGFIAHNSGKTFVLAIYITWRIFTHEFYHISCMGGSSEQSDKVQNYITGWIRHNEDLRKFTLKNVRRSMKTFAESSVSFHSCSATSVRGPHVRDIIIDEEAAGEERGGTRYIKAAMWEISTAKDMRIIKSSTPHLTFGDFLETWNEFDKLGFKRYQWAIAKHTDGQTDPYKIYKDTIPSHWVTNVPWAADKTIQHMRRQKSNEEWLVEALGAISMSSGLVFKPTDIDTCVCNECEVCHPYENPSEHFAGCPLIRYYLLLEGMRIDDAPKMPKQALQYVGDRVEGIDWGKVAPDCYSAIARYGDTVFVLDFKELYGQDTDEKIGTADNMAKKWSIEIIRPDPEQWAYAEKLQDMGYAVHELFSFEGGNEKERYVYNLKKYVERHNIKIPKIFQSLIRSLKNLTYDESGKVRKVDDHCFDSLIYAISLYGEENEAPVLGPNDLPEGSGAKLWKDKGEPEPPPPTEAGEEPPKPPKPEDFNPFNEEYLKRKKRESLGEGGVKIW